MKTSTLKMLQKARDIARTTFLINSGFRTPERNKRVGGSATSSHLKGYAVDIHCNDSYKRHKIIRALLIAGFKRIGIYKTFIHVDNDPDKAGGVMWIKNR